VSNQIKMAICFCFLYIILVAIATIAVANQDQDDKIGSSSCPSKQQQHQHNYCTLYLAESSIPNAGLGIYSGVQLGINETLTTRHLDVVIPIYDIELHNDYNKKFQWIISDYAWLASKLGVDIEAKRVTALAPGLGALANNHHALANIAFNGVPSRDDDDEEEGLHHHTTISSGSITPYYGLKHYATSSIKVGSELFHDYGARWGEKRTTSLGPIPLKEHYKKADTIIDCFRIFLINASLCVHDTLAKDIWNNNVRLVRNSTINDVSMLISTSHLGFESEKIITPLLREMLLTRSCQVKEVRTEAALNFPYSAMEDAMEIGSARAYLQLQSFIRPLSWLEENGRCIDGLSIAPSSSILRNNGGGSGRGRGAFATRNFDEFDIITTTPLLPINRTLLETYQFSMNHPGKQRKLSTRKLGRQLLLNYCYGHRDSSLLFFPYGPAVNMINHGGKNNTNAWIQFSNFSSFHQNTEWKSNYSVEDILNKDKSTRLIFDIIATKPIQPGDEIFLDYGKEWENAWERYVDSWNPPGDGVQFSNQNKNKKPYISNIHRPSAFRKSIGMSDELFPEVWRDML
ncbi:MAG: hypothetical protein ACI8RD_007408, partial [Bacillariaceae sp.]|jgi:hypothetical protein